MQLETQFTTKFVQVLVENYPALRGLRSSTRVLKLLQVCIDSEYTALYNRARDGDGGGYDAEEDEELDQNTQLHWESLHDCWRVHRRATATTNPE